MGTENRLRPPDRPEVMLVENHVMVGQALADAMRARAGTRTAIVHNIAEARAYASQHRPDVALVDFRLPDGDGAAATNAIHEVSPDTAVVILTAADASDVLESALAAGAIGFLHKARDIEEVIRAVELAAAGEAAFSAEDLAAMARHHDDAGATSEALTDREREVLQLLTNGLSTDAIADRLVLSRHTVRNHIRNATGKLGAHSKLEAVLIGLRRGIVTLGGGPS